MTYAVDGVVYTYTYIVDGDAVIAVTIGGGQSDEIYFKLNGTWVKAVKVYKKVNGSWVEQTGLTAVFDPTKKYVKGGA